MLKTAARSHDRLQFLSTGGVVAVHKVKLTTYIYAMGHSAKAPSPNRKNPTLPESTTATTMVFLPAFSAIKGCGLRGGG